MSDGRKKLGSIIIGPMLVVGGILGLWENEGRFNYYEAANDTVEITSPADYTGEPVSFTSQLDTQIPINGEYVRKFVSYHMVKRHAEIYSWDESRSDGNTTWSKGWHSHLENNSRNRHLTQKLSSRNLYPRRYVLGDTMISPDRIHFADEAVPISADALQLTGKGRSLRLLQRENHLYLDKGAADDLGDERVSYEGIPNAAVATYFGVFSDKTGIGRQFEVNTGFISKIIANDGILHHLVNGDREQALKTVKADFTALMWRTRFIGTAVIVVGIYVFFSSFMSLLYRIPLLGDIVEVGVILVSLVIGIPLASIVILTGLLVNNPFSVALPLAIVVGGGIYFFRRSKTTKKNAQRVLNSRLAGQKSKPAPGSNRTAPVFDRSSHSAPAAAFAAANSPGAESAKEQAPGPESNAASNTARIEQTFIHLAMLALAEGGLDKKENKMLITWGNENGIPKDRMKALFAEAKTGEIETHPSTREDLELLTCMALVDGELSRSEWAMLVKFATKMGRTAFDVRNIISDIETGKLAPA